MRTVRRCEVGDKFGTWTVLRELEPRVYKTTTKRRVEVRCDCGAVSQIARQHLVARQTSRCRGCASALTRPNLRKTVVPVATRLLSRLDTTGECHVWTGRRDRDGLGYGTMSVGRRTVRVHRIAWEIANGRPIPDGLDVLHKCDNPPCCRAEHLFLGTALDNARDMVEKGRWRGPKVVGLDDEMPRIIAMHHGGMGVNLIAEATGFNAKTLRNRLDVAGCLIRRR